MLSFLLGIAILVAVTALGLWVVVRTVAWWERRHWMIPTPHGPLKPPSDAVLRAARREYPGGPDAA